MAAIRMLEGLSLPGSKDRENDDAMGCTSEIAFVLDGVTSLAEPPLMGGRSDAAWVAHLARDLLVKHKPKVASDLPRFIAGIAEEITLRFEAGRLRPPVSRHELPWTTLSIIALEGNRLHIAFLGDSRILIETADDAVHNYGIPVSRSAFEKGMAKKMIAAGQGIGVEVQRQTIQADLQRSRETVNTPQGYWLLGADASVSGHLNMATLDLNGSATVLLATDGFYALTEDYRHYGDRELIATSQVVGLQTLGHELRHVEELDPLGHKYPRMKKSDDATALLVRIEL